MQYAFVTLAAALLAGELPAGAAEAPTRALTITGCQVTLIDEVEVPAQEQGVLTNLAIREGDQVVEGDLLAQIDDRKSQVLQEVAQYKLDVANEEAGNDINRRYAEAAALVAAEEVRSAIAANDKAPGAVPQTEVNRLVLQHEQYRLQIEQAAHELGIAKVTVLVREAELQAARQDVAFRQIVAPFDGVVEKLYRRKGEWVQPGEPVMKMLRMDQLRVEGYVDGKRYTPDELRGQPVRVTVPLPGGQEHFMGKVVFVSSTMDAGMRFLVKAEVDNRRAAGGWLLRSGVNAEMMIALP